MPDTMSVERRNLLKAYGAELESRAKYNTVIENIDGDTTEISREFL